MRHHMIQMNGKQFSNHGFMINFFKITPDDFEQISGEVEGHVFWIGHGLIEENKCNVFEKWCCVSAMQDVISHKVSVLDSKVDH